MKNVIVTFGEIMTRLSAPGHHRLRQCLPGSLDVAFAGAESNIAASIALLGGRSRFVTALPQNLLGDACVGFLRSLGVETSCILWTSAGRMPHYFIETGVGQRPGQVLYDRAGSSFSLTEGADYAWEAALDDASWLVLSGISPALSETAARATLHAAKAARARGVTVCCDLNYRARLWDWEPGTPPRDLARRVMAELMPHVDVVLSNPEQVSDVLDIPWFGAAPGDIAAFGAAARHVAQAHPHLKLVVFTMRENISASHNNLGALLYDPAADRVVAAPQREGRYHPWEMRAIVDRLGAGDAFAGGLIYALHTRGLDAPSVALDFAVAAACLAHSIPGDVNFVSRAEIEALMNGDGSGRVIR
ncbi:sugar kinase, ribokinase [Opitutaceae bacterium TAV1]|nr:sugar kinase, ribokinase [Opitutaceae bacterium TAV1]